MAQARPGLKTFLLAALAAAALAAFTSDAAASTGACEREIQSAAAKYGIPEGILYSVGLTETGRKGSLYPSAMNVEGKAIFPPSEEDAMRQFDVARRSGAKLIDIGCMQINHYYHSDKFTSVRAMFDPARNVEYAARFLKELKRREGSWTMAVARYNAGPNNQPAQKRYVCHIVAHLVSSGFGAWTDKARSFCQPKTS